MVSKNNIQHKMEADAKRVPHYGLRKLGIGVASVLLGTTLYFGNAQAIQADTVNTGNQATENEKQTTTSNTLNGTEVTLSDDSKVTNASNETSESNNGNTDQSDITTTKSNNESTQNSIGKVQDDGQKSANSITQTIDTDNVNNASQAILDSKLSVNNATGTNVTNDNSISTVTHKSTDGRYSLTFKSYGVMGQNGSTVPDSAFINGKITFPLLLHGNVQNGDTVVITIPYADTYTVNAQSLSSKYGTQSIISGSNTSDWIITYSFSRSATLNLEIDIEGSNNGYGAKNHPLSDPAGDTKKTIKWSENGTEQDNTGLNFISRQMPSWNPNQQLNSSTLINGKQLINSNVVYSYTVKEDNGTVHSQAGNPSYPSDQINNTLNYGTTITIPMPEGFVLDVNATNKLVPGFYGDNKQAEIKQEGNNVIITVPSGKGAQGWESKPGYQFVGHYDIKNPSTTTFTETANNRINIVEKLNVDGSLTKEFTSDKPVSESFWGTKDKVPITNVSTWVRSAWHSGYGQDEIMQWQDDHDQIIAYAGLQNGYSLNLNQAKITFTIPDGMIVHGLRVPAIDGTTSYAYEYTLDDGTVHKGTVKPGDKIEIDDLSRTITSITLTPDVIDSSSGTAVFNIADQALSYNNNYFNAHEAVSTEVPNMFELYGHVAKTKRDGHTLVKNGEVWKCIMKLSAVSNGDEYSFDNTKNSYITVFVPSQRDSAALSSLLANTGGNVNLTVDSDSTNSQTTNLVIRTLYNTDQLSKLASTTTHIKDAILYIKLPKGITYRGLTDSDVAIKNAKLSVFQDNQSNTIVKIDYTGSYYDMAQDIDMQLGTSPDVVAGSYPIKTLLYSPNADLMLWTKDSGQNKGEKYTPGSDESGWLTADTDNLYRIDYGTNIINVNRTISGLNTISMSKGDQDVADNSTKGKSSTAGNGKMLFAVSISNGQTDAISNAETIIDLPSKDNGSGFDFHLSGPVTYSGTTPLNFKYSTSYVDLNKGKTTNGYIPETTGFVTGDKVKDWSTIKSILVEIPTLPASSIIGRIVINGNDESIKTDGGKTGYLATGLYTANHIPYVDMQSAQIDVVDAQRTVNYQFVDDDNNGANVGDPVAVKGNVGSNQNVSLTIPAGYKLPDDKNLPTSVTIGENDQTIDIHLNHAHHTIEPTAPVPTDGETESGATIKGAHEADLNQTITRTINITDPQTKQTTTTTQTAKISRSADVDEVTGDVKYGAWSTDATGWSAFEVPTIAGYTPSQASVDPVTVKDGQKDVTIDISYNQNVYSTTINYVDENGKKVKTDTVSGHNGDKIEIRIPDGYHVEGGNLPQLTISSTKPVQTVNVVKDQHATDNPEVVTKPVLNIIKYVDENGNVVKTETVTGKLGDQITLTLPAGYHFKDGETPNLVITESGAQIVNVVKDRQVTPENPTINDHDKKNNNSAVNNNGASQDNNGKKVSTSSTGQSDNANNHKQSQLPQTGNESRNSFSAAGLALASLTSLIGLAGFKKKRD
jgi:LPXTG-motif cell wall-anchored protein